MSEVKNLGPVPDCELEYKSQVREAHSNSERWLGLIASIEGGQIVLRWTTCQFPNEDWKTMLNLIQKEAEKLLLPPPIVPLPLGGRFAQSRPYRPAGPTPEEVGEEGA